MDKEYSGAISTIVGMCIGAGILGVPYVISKSGFIIGAVHIIVLGSIMIFINLLLGEVSLRTKGCHQLIGYAERYLRKPGKILMLFAALFGFYGAMVAYTTKSGDFISQLFPFLTPIMGSLVFFIIFGIFILSGLKIIEKSELSIIILLLVTLAVILISALPHMTLDNLAFISAPDGFLPYGVVMFAFLAFGAIPELREELQRKPEKMKKAIIIGGLIPMAVYLIFTAIVVGSCGLQTTEGAIIGLSMKIGPVMALLGYVFGLLAMASSFIAVGLALKELYRYDFGLKPSTSTIITLLVPFVLWSIIVATNLNNAFFHILDITGIIVGGLTGLLAIFMHYKAKKLGNRKPEYSITSNPYFYLALSIIFIIGTIVNLS